MGLLSFSWVHNHIEFGPSRLPCSFVRTCDKVLTTRVEAKVKMRCHFLIIPLKPNVCIALWPLFLPADWRLVCKAQPPEMLRQKSCVEQGKAPTGSWRLTAELWYETEIPFKPLSLAYNIVTYHLILWSFHIFIITHFPNPPTQTRSKNKGTKDSSSLEDGGGGNIRVFIDFCFRSCHTQLIC